MLRLSKRANDGLLALKDLAEHSSGAPRAARDIAKTSKTRDIAKWLEVNESARVRYRATAPPR